MNEVVIGAVKKVAKGAAVHLDFSTMNWPGAVVLSVGLIAGACAFDSYMKYGHMNMHMPTRKVHNAEFTRKYQTQLSLCLVIQDYFVNIRQYRSSVVLYRSAATR